MIRNAAFTPYGAQLMLDGNLVICDDHLNVRKLMMIQKKIA